MEVYTTKSKLREYLLLVSDKQDMAKIIDAPFMSCVQVREMPLDLFRKTHFHEQKFPLDKACAILVRRAKDVGATEEALKILGKHTPITQQEFDMAKEKAETAKEKTTKAPKPKAEPKAKAPKEKAEAAPKEPKEKRYSAAQMFQDLIMEGKLTDSQIFAKVQEKFGLDDKKSGYVKWYRNHLKKNGQNPPEAKPEPGAEKAKAEPKAKK